MFRSLVLSFSMLIGAELAFTTYLGVYDLSNFLGHILKILSFYFIYQAIIVTGLMRQYDLLFRNLKKTEEMLIEARDNLEQQVEERTLSLRENEKTLLRRTHDLGERVKELNCLYSISKLAEKSDLSLEKFLQGAVDLIPPGWQYPEITCARLKLDGMIISSRNFKESEWKQASDIKVKGKKSGDLEVYYLEEKPESDEGPFLKEERDLIEAIAEKLGNTLNRKHAEEEVQDNIRRLNALREIDRAITSSFDLGVTLSILIKQASVLLEIDAATVLLLKPEKQTLEFSVGQGFRTEVLQHTNLRMGEGFAGKAALERRVIQITDMHNLNTGFLRSPEFHLEEFVAYIGIPLIAKGNVNGVLEIYQRKPLDHDPDWMAFLETLAGQAAIAIENISLLNDLRLSNQDLLLAYDATIEGWAQALELRDMETVGHSRRVVDLTLELARALDIKHKDIQHIIRGALLHDIGKMGIPIPFYKKMENLPMMNG